MFSGREEGKRAWGLTKGDDGVWFYGISIYLSIQAFRKDSYKLQG